MANPIFGGIFFIQMFLYGWSGIKNGPSKIFSFQTFKMHNENQKNLQSLKILHQKFRMKLK